jgi:hypothetical protein
MPAQSRRHGTGLPNAIRAFFFFGPHPGCLSVPPTTLARLQHYAVGQGWGSGLLVRLHQR